MGHDVPQRVAIVGTGLAGLTTAYLLQHDEEQRYAVTLFEQAEKLSFDSASVAIRDGKSGAIERVDLPMRALAGGYYANVMRMYDHLGIPYHPIRFLFSFTKASSSRKPDVPSAEKSANNPEGTGGPGEYFIHASNLHRIPPWPGTRGMISHLAEIVFLIICHFWFSLACFVVRPRTEPHGGETLAEYVRRIWLPRRFVSHYLLPLMSSVATCSHDEMLAFPASDVVEYKRRTHGQQHYTVCGGVHRVESRLARGMRDVRLGTQVVELLPTADGRVKIRWQAAMGDDVSISDETFDRVVLAVSPDVVRKIFTPLRTLLEKVATVRVQSSVLRSVKSSPTDIFSVVEGDTRSSACSHHRGSMMPTQVICFKTDFTSNPRSEALHTMPGGTVVSTCPLNPSEETKRVLRTARFTRTLRTTSSREIMRNIMDRRTSSGSGSKMGFEEMAASAWTNGEDNVWLAGAWCWDGMVLLEGCLISAMAIADDFGVKVPWREESPGI